MNEMILKVKRWIWNIKFSEYKEYGEVQRNSVSDGRLKAGLWKEMIMKYW